MGHRPRFALLLMLLALAALVAAPVAAGANGNKPERTTVTEDTDHDGVPNTPDPEGDSDNRHPSGRDKHAESGGSGNQGNSVAAPDQDGRGPDRDHGGTDKPGHDGGMDELDQDGNNGCGNDDDFEDDNEGWCGKPDRGAEGTGPEGSGPEGTGPERDTGRDDERDEQRGPGGDDELPTPAEGIGGDTIAIGDTRETRVLSAMTGPALPATTLSVPGAPGGVMGLAFTGIGGMTTFGALLLAAAAALGAAMRRRSRRADEGARV